MYHYLGRYYLPALLLTVFNVLGSQFSADWLLLLFSDQITPHSYWRMQIKKGKGFDAASITIRISRGVKSCSLQAVSRILGMLLLLLAEEFSSTVVVSN